MALLSQAQCLGGHTALPRWETELSWLFPGQQRKYGSSVTLQPPLCKGGTAWQSHAGGIDGVAPLPYSPRLYGLRPSVLRLCR